MPISTGAGSNRKQERGWRNDLRGLLYLRGAWPRIERKEDERGFFACTSCRQELAARGLEYRDGREKAFHSIGTAARCPASIFSDRRMKRPKSCGARAARS